MKQKRTNNAFLVTDENGKAVVRLLGGVTETPIRLIEYLKQGYRSGDMKYCLKSSYLPRGGNYVKYAFEKNSDSSDPSLFIVTVKKSDIENPALISTVQTLDMFKTDEIRKIKVNLYRLAALLTASFVLFSSSYKRIRNAEEPKSESYNIAHDAYIARENEKVSEYVKDYMNNIRNIAEKIYTGYATEDEIVQFQKHLLKKGLITEENIEDYKKYVPSCIVDDSICHPEEDQIPHEKLRS